DRVCAKNWREGTCSHDLLCEAPEDIMHVRWVGDELAFGTDGGGTYIVEMEGGSVVNAFEGHDSDVTGVK
ncbi:unnamed protein product, partial [Discosporangium mesarthrocarpum]